MADCSAEELEPRLMQAGCPAAKVRTTPEVLRTLILRERHMLQSASVPGRDDAVTLVNAGFVADDDGPGLQRGIPALGAHTEGVLQNSVTTMRTSIDCAHVARSRSPSSVRMNHYFVAVPGVARSESRLASNVLDVIHHRLATGISRYDLRLTAPIDMHG